MTIGVLCLDTAFQKIPGHIRNPATFDFPVDYQVVVGATPQRVVSEADPALLVPFIDAARALQARGCAAITGACGFLVLFQRELAASVSVPLYASSLIQLPMVARMIRPDQRVGLLVANKGALTRRHLAAIGGDRVPVCVAGVENSDEFREVMMEGRRVELDADRLEREIMVEVDALVEANPDIGALIIECTDLVPFAYAIQARIGKPVFDIVTLTQMVQAGLTRRPYSVRR